MHLLDSLVKLFVEEIRYKQATFIVFSTRNQLVAKKKVMSRILRDTTCL